MALLHDIPLVFYGENEAEYGNPIADTDAAKRDWSYFTAEDKIADLSSAASRCTT